MAMASVPGEVSLTGAVLSRRYLLKREIGRGGMGTVYAAEPVAGGPAVAIKILHSYFLCDEQVMIRFHEEGRTCMRLIHPNIVRVHECLAAEDGTPYLVMDLLEGVPLSAYTKDGGRVALGRAIPILQGMLAGLEAAHALGVVHRDLKPGNVFLARTGGIFSVKLLDFGIAKVMDAAGGMGSKTSTGALLGTPAYMSPEQVKSAKDVDGRSDLWSIGVMFYEMLSGRVAFPAPTEYARLAAVISTRPKPIETIDPDLAPVSLFLERALEKDRDRRFQTSREMSLALGALTPAGSLGDTGGGGGFRGGASQETAAATPMAAKNDAGPWSMQTDKTDPPSGALPPPSPPPVTPDPRDVLTAQLLVAPQTSTLASPNRRSASPPANLETPPAPVVIVPEEELAKARRREVSSDEAIVLPMRRGVGWGLVALFIVVALAIGFGAGFLVGQSR